MVEIAQAIEMTKSSRHSKITGDFAEALIVYWYGFECARIDHTGMDVIARNPHRPRDEPLPPSA
jgi:hypothetical protein